jgi:hypothetical protein
MLENSHQAIAVTLLGSKLEVLNGYPVIASLPRMHSLMNGRRATIAHGIIATMIVVVHRYDHEHQPFVVAEWAPGLGSSWNDGDYVDSLDEALAAMVRRAGLKLPKPHDEGATPPAGFTRYRIEMPVPIELDSSALLERMQATARELIEETEDPDESDGPPLDDTAIELILEDVSVQAMEG